MVTYIAWLRGINVGGKNRLPMKGLVATLEGIGLQNVRTYIQSGNVAFEARKRSCVGLGEEVAAAVAEQHGLDVPVLVLTRGELEAALEANPYPDGEGKAVHFSFLSTRPRQADLAALAAVATASESFELLGMVFYLHAPDGVGRSKLAANVERCLGVPATARNLNTVLRMVEL
ncbi:MAG: DUF1697 domain-containing protein [bacterium]|nr:DUF1697 domain-containing protein [bacterium]